MSNMDDFYRPYLTTNETRYNELLMVADYRMVSHCNNTESNLVFFQFGCKTISCNKPIVLNKYKERRPNVILDCKREVAVVWKKTLMGLHHLPNLVLKSKKQKLWVNSLTSLRLLLCSLSSLAFDLINELLPEMILLTNAEWINSGMSQMGISKLKNHTALQLSNC